MKYNQNDITVTESENVDVLNMCDHLRQADVTEIEAIGLTPKQALKDSFEESVERYTVKLKGKPIAMFGLNPDDFLGKKAKIWILATDDLKIIQRRFTKHSKDFINEAFEKYSVLYNFIDVRNTDSIKWLEWLGASFNDPIPYGVNGEMFSYFEFSQRSRLAKVMNDISIQPRKKIMMFEKILEQHPNAIFADDYNAPPLQHDFVPGMYTRTIFIPKNMVLTGAIHKQTHPSFLLKGKVDVFTEENGLQHLEAPQVFMSKAGCKRVVYTLENTIWSTVHLNPTNTHDINEIKEIISTNNFDELIEEDIVCLSGM